MKIGFTIPFIFVLLLTGACQSAQNKAGSHEGGPQNVSKSANHQNGNTSIGHIFWDNRQIFYKDFTGDSSAEAYQAIRGQKYFENTFIIVYSSLEDLEGTTEYAKLEETLKSTNLDDRIFIWVHLTNDKKVKFIKKLISDNIRDVINEGPNEL